MKYIDKINQQRQNHLLFLIGHSQVALKHDHRVVWVASEFVSMFQSIGILFAYKVILNSRMQQQDKLDTTEFAITQQLFQTIFAIVELLNQFSVEVTIISQLFILIFLSSVLFINIVAIRIEYQTFQFEKMQNNKLFIQMEDNRYQSLGLLNSTYNYSDFVEHFLLKQLMGNNNDSFIDQLLNRVVYVMNYYSQTIFLPLFYYSILMYDRLALNTTYSEGVKSIMYQFNSMILLLLLVIQYHALLLQQSYRLQDSNQLRLHVTGLFVIHQYLRVVPLLIIYALILAYDTVTLYDSTILRYILSVVVIGQLIIQLYDNFIHLPYVQNYKLVTYSIAFSISFTLSFTQLFTTSDRILITITTISTPILTQLVYQYLKYKVNVIIHQTLKCEIKVTKKNAFTSFRKTKRTFQKQSIHMTEQHLIEQAIRNQTQEQFTQIRQFKNDYVLQFLKLYENLEIYKQQVLQQGNKVNPKLTKFMIQCIMLIKQHTDQCNNIYCYCRGMNGTRMTVIEKNYKSMKMKIYDDFEDKGILFSIELINRYVRQFIKLMVKVCTHQQQNINLAYISQLITPLCASDESFQAFSLIMEIQQFNKQSKQNYDKKVLRLMMSYAKYCTLYRTQFEITNAHISKTITYEDFRYSEKLCNKLIAAIFVQVADKRRNLVKITEKIHSFQYLQSHYIQSVTDSNKLYQKLLSFYTSSQCKSSCLLMMFYLLNVKCDYIQFIQYKNALKTKETKFFETQLNSDRMSKVCFLKLNISRFTKSKNRGEIMLVSENCHHFFGYGREQFKKEITTIQQLVPHSVNSVHNALIELFLMSNKPNIIRLERELLALKNDSELMYVEMFIDYCFQVTDTEFPIYCFLKEIQSTGQFERIRGHILVDQYGFIEGVSKQAYSSFCLLNSRVFIDKEISDFLPNFELMKNAVQKQLEQFLSQEQDIIFQGPNSGLINPDKTIYTHFQVQFDQELFNLHEQESFVVDLQFVLVYGIVDSTESKFYVIELHKVESVYDDEIEYIKEKDKSSISLQSNEIIAIAEEKPFNEQIDLTRYQQIQCGIHDFVNNFNESSQSNIVTATRQTYRKQEMYFSKQTKEQRISEDLVGEQQEVESKSSEDKVALTPGQIPDEQKMIQKSMYYSEFAYNQSYPLISHVINVTNIFVLVIICTFLITSNTLFSKYGQQIIPTTQVLQAFITTEYTDNLQMAVFLQKAINDKSTSSEEFNAIAYLLQKDAQKYIKSQQEYFQNEKIRNIFSQTYITMANGNLESAWNGAFNILYQQHDYFSIDLLSRVQDPLIFGDSIKNLVNDFSYHKHTYEIINIQFKDLLLSTIDKFSGNQQVIMYLLFASFLLSSFCCFLVYQQYFKLLQKYCKATEQVSFDAIDNEINILQGLLYFKTHFQLYEYHMSLRGMLESHVCKQSQSNYYLNNKSSQTNVKKYVKINNKCSLYESTYFMIPLISFTFCFLVMTYIIITLDDTMKDFRQGIIFYDKSIQFQQSFSLVCFSGIIIEHSDDLLQKGYITNNITSLFIEYANASIIESKALSKEIRLPTKSRSDNLIKQLSANFCTIFTDNVEIEWCSRVNNGLLKRGLLESSQTYINYFRDNFNIDYNKSLIQLMDAEDLLAINLIIKGIYSYVSNARAELTSIITSSISDKYNLFISALILCIINQFIICFRIMKDVRFRIRTLKESLYLLPRETLYNEDSFMKSLTYVSVVENNLRQ